MPRKLDIFVARRKVLPAGAQRKCPSRMLKTLYHSLLTSQGEQNKSPKQMVLGRKSRYATKLLTLWFASLGNFQQMRKEYVKSSEWLNAFVQRVYFSILRKVFILFFILDVQQRLRKTLWLSSGKMIFLQMCKENVSKPPEKGKKFRKTDR